MNILDQIIASKKSEVARRMQITSIDQLESAELFNRSSFSLADRLRKNQYGGIIAEFKRRSPSKGVINDRLNPVDVAKSYDMAGASGISVLTDAPFFGGSSQDLMDVRQAVDIPLLRKDFIIDPYQVYETKALGADVILLIAANLERDLCADLAKLSRELDLEVLLEIHVEEELDHITDTVSMIGINNRNLKTFEVDLEHSMRLSNKIDNRFVKIAESGLSNIENIRTLRTSGFNGFLIGEYFMKQEQPGVACTSLIQQL